MTESSATKRPGEQTTDNTAIRPFHKAFPASDITELRRRINGTRWPVRETVNDASQGVQLATTQKFARYWGTDYDWSKCQAKLEALPQFMTNIDGLDIHPSNDETGSRHAFEAKLGEHVSKICGDVLHFLHEGGFVCLRKPVPQRVLSKAKPGLTN